jgi:LCP family protein required for cell wall assembly
MKINLLEKTEELAQPPKKRSFFWKSAIAAAVIVPLFFVQSTFLPNFNPFLRLGSVLETFQFENITEWVSQIGKLIRSGDKTFKGEKEDRINFLLLGMGGVGHEGPYLTDTIILMSFKPKEKQVAMVSIPRDLLVPISGYGQRKINNVNAFAEMKERGSGGTVASQVVSDVFQIPIHYYIRADFAGFESLVDKLGGLSVYVDKSFTDYQYPTDDFKYQVLSFEEGWQIMDGATALKFVRSRHGTNGEASDFARSRRQQKILIALKDKILSMDTFLNPFKLQGVYEASQNSISTNLEMWELLKLKDLSEGIDSTKIIHKVISDDPGGLLRAANVDGAYILEPKAGNFSELQALVKNIFETGTEIVFEKKPEPTRVEIQNGTKKTGLAGRTSQMLSELGYKVVKVGNAKEQNYERTVIYDLTGGKKIEELNFLREKIDADLSLTVPSWMTSSVTPTEVTIFNPPETDSTQKYSSDFLIILGQNANF